MPAIFLQRDHIGRSTNPVELPRLELDRDISLFGLHNEKRSNVTEELEGELAGDGPIPSLPSTLSLLPLGDRPAPPRAKPLHRGNRSLCSRYDQPISACSCRFSDEDGSFTVEEPGGIADVLHRWREFGVFATVPHGNAETADFAVNPGVSEDLLYLGDRPPLFEVEVFDRLAGDVVFPGVLVAEHAVFHALILPDSVENVKSDHV